MIRKWYNLTLHNGTLEGNIIQFKDTNRTADHTQETMQHYVDQSRKFGDANVVKVIVDYLLDIHDPKADAIDGDTHPEEFVEIPFELRLFEDGGDGA